MVYCNLKGGLGNIMFQVAATKSISINKNTDCAFPNLNSYLTFLNNERLHNPFLQHAHEYLNVFKNINLILKDIAYFFIVEIANLLF